MVVKRSQTPFTLNGSYGLPVSALTLSSVADLIRANSGLLVAACGTHLLTGLLFITDVCQTDTAGGRAAVAFLLIFSCLMVFAICTYACSLQCPAVFENGVRPEKGEAEANMDHGMHDVERAVPRPTPEAESGQRLEMLREAGTQQNGVGDRQASSTSEHCTENIDTLKQVVAAQDAGVAGLGAKIAAPGQEPHSAAAEPVNTTEERSLGMTVSEEASMVEGLRQLIVHHIRKTGVHTLTDAQAYLLDRHLPRLSSYSEKIVHSISFANRILATMQDPKAAEAADTSESKASMAAADTPQPSARKKILKLEDMEILQLYSDAVKEAESEADWRGIADWPTSASSRATSSVSSSRHDERKEWREGLELLGQALADGQSLRAASGELLKQQLLPVNTASCASLAVTGAPPVLARQPELECCRIEQGPYTDERT